MRTNRGGVMRWAGLLVVAGLLGCSSTRTERVAVTFHPPQHFLEEQRLTEHGIQTIAVVGLKEQGVPLKNAWELVTDELSLQLGRTTDFQLVERLRIDALLFEMDMAPGVVDDATARKVGRMVGADGVILGTFRVDPGEWSLSARLVEVESGLQDWQARAHAAAASPGGWPLSATETVRELCGRIASTLSPWPAQETKEVVGSRRVASSGKSGGNWFSESPEKVLAVALAVAFVGGIVVAL